MNKERLKEHVQIIVKKACELKNRHTDEKTARVNYACIFAQNQEEFEKLLFSANQLGKVIQETPTGPLFQIEPLDTIAGKLQILKIRKPDPNRIELGDADFTVEDYGKFKSIHLLTQGFKLIERPTMEMIELMEPSLDVLAYFSNPPIDEELGIRQIKEN